MFEHFFKTKTCVLSKALKKKNVASGQTTNMANYNDIKRKIRHNKRKENEKKNYQT